LSHARYTKRHTHKRDKEARCGVAATDEGFQKGFDEVLRIFCYTENMKIEFNKVTWYSKLLAIIVFIGAIILAFCLGGMYQESQIAPVAETKQEVSTQEISQQTNRRCTSIDDVMTFCDEYTYMTNEHLGQDVVTAQIIAYINSGEKEVVYEIENPGPSHTQSNFLRIDGVELNSEDEYEITYVQGSSGHGETDPKVISYSSTPSQTGINLPPEMKVNTESPSGEYAIIGVNTMEEEVTFLAFSNSLMKEIGEREFIIDNQQLAKNSLLLKEREEFFGHFGHAVLSDFDMNGEVIVNYYPHFYCNYVLDCTDDTSVVERYIFSTNKLVNLSTQVSQEKKF